MRRAAPDTARPCSPWPAQNWSSALIGTRTRLPMPRSTTRATGSCSSAATCSNSRTGDGSTLRCRSRRSSTCTIIERCCGASTTPLEPGGMLLLSTPNRNVTSPGRSPLNEHHVREFSVPEILDELRAVGFRPQSVAGQRRQPRMPGAQPQRVYARLMRPAQRSSPEVRPVGTVVVGRIVVIVAVRG